jgi:hypothetical protein
VAALPVALRRSPGGVVTVVSIDIERPADEVFACAIDPRSSTSGRKGQADLLVCGESRSGSWRRSEKNARISVASNCGSSMAANCPPAGASVQRLRSATFATRPLGWIGSSAGNAATPNGTVIRFFEDRTNGSAALSR